jgi:hypothetical protein
VIEVARRLVPAALHLEGKRMEPGKVARKVLEKIAEGRGQKALVAECGADVRYPAYAKYTPPKYATRPTAGASYPTAFLVSTQILHSALKG